MLLFGLTVHASGQWESLNGSVASHIRALCVMGDRIFAGTAGAGVYCSSDHGGSWYPTNTGLGDAVVQALAVAGNVLLAGTPEGIFISTDGGTAWSATHADPSSPNACILAVSGARIFAGTSAGILVSSDGGKNWNPAGTGLSAGDVHALIAAGSDLFAGTAHGALYRSSDEGANWTQTAGALKTSVYALAMWNGVLYAGCANGGILASSDKGATWNSVPTPLSDSTVWSMAATDSAFFAGGRGGVVLSADNGATWFMRRTSSWADLYGGSTDVRTLAAADTTLFAGLDHNGVYCAQLGKTQGMAGDWGVAGWNLQPIRWSHTFASSGKRLFVGAANGLFRSDDLGKTWVPRGRGIPVWGDLRDLAVIGPDSIMLAAEAMPDSRGGVYRSIDHGETWSKTTSVLPDSTIYSAFLLSGTDVFVASGAGIFRSTDYGATWSPSGTYWQADGVRLAWALTQSGGRLLAGTEPYLYASTDWGGSWFVLNDRMGYISSFAACGNYLYALTTSTWIGGVYRSGDGGSTWTKLNDHTNGAFAVSGNDLFFSSGSTIAVSGNDGNTWAEVATASDQVSANALFVNGGYLYGAGSAVWRRPLAQVTTSVPQEHPGTGPKSFFLDQNFPNPFNPSTTIRFSVPHRSHVTLAVFNTLGQKVAELVNGDIDAGYHEVQFNASGMASGVYFYRLQADTYAQTRKLLLLQ